nr:hypothetical protein [Tanacetum cinerariifolium]
MSPPPTVGTITTSSTTNASHHRRLPAAAAVVAGCGNKMVRDGQLEFAVLVALDKRQSRFPSPFIRLRNPCT